MMVVAHYCECIKCHCIVQFKIVKLVSFMLCGEGGRKGGSKKPVTTTGV